MRQIEIDKRDEEIIDILSTDARISNREVARTMELSEAAIRKRIRRLEDSGAARVVAVIDASVLGYNMSAMLRIAASPGTARSIAEHLTSFESVVFVALTTGAFNVTVTVIVADRDELTNFIHDVVDPSPGVIEIELIEIVSVAKYRTDIIYLT